ncbi:small secreted protein [Streptomyces sp. RFCAC02]|uniref:small secreted protein n=1 Tax=Streptomyces sp. RFCAC02 TaxID=2499143 RepID=UPI00101F2203|nr:small secreted protein [Streptomyces sp. RFCAC02]
MNTKLAAALACCAGLTLTLSGCGDDSQEKLDAWAKDFCGRLVAPLEDLQSAGEENAEYLDMEQDRSPEEVQELNSAYYGQLADAYDALADAVEGAGEPPVDDGTERSDAAVSALRDTAGTYREMKETVDGLDPSDTTAFVQGLFDAGEQSQQLGESSDQVLPELGTGDLGEAMGRQEDCRRVTPSDGSSEDASPDAGATEDADGAGDEEAGQEDAGGDGEDGEDSDNG